MDNLIVAKAVGLLLSYYHSDLLYIANFQKFKKGQLSTDKILKKEKGSLRSFINEYRIARNLSNGATNDLANFIKVWVNTNSSNEVNDVDKLAVTLMNLNFTHNKQMTSLASKILFLNNPWEILPMDRYTRKAVGLRNNRYSEYQSYISKYKIYLKPELEKILLPINPFIQFIEKDYKSDLTDLETIRKNRLLDKLLWVEGEREINQ